MVRSKNICLQNNSGAFRESEVELLEAKLKAQNVLLVTSFLSLNQKSQELEEPERKTIVPGKHVL